MEVSTKAEVKVGNEIITVILVYLFILFFASVYLTTRFIYECYVDARWLILNLIGIKTVRSTGI